MVSSVNKIILLGNLGHNPEVHHTLEGQKIVHFSLATSEVWKDQKTGERRDRTEWHRVVVFNEKLADVCDKYLRKGSKIYIEGRLQTRKWVDNAGQERFITEVILQRYRGELVMLDNRSESSLTKTEPPLGSGTLSHDLEDEIPF